MLIALLAILVVFVLMSLILVLIKPLNTVESETDFAYNAVESDLSLVASVNESVCCFNKFVFMVEVLTLIKFLSKVESILSLFKLVIMSAVFSEILFSLEVILDASVRESAISFARLFAILVFAVLMSVLSTFESAIILVYTATESAVDLFFALKISAARLAAIKFSAAVALATSAAQSPPALAVN